MNNKIVMSVSFEETTNDEMEFGGYQRVTIDREYNNDARWVVLLYDFIKLLSAQYGYDISDSIREKYGWDISEDVYNRAYSSLTTRPFDASIFDNNGFDDEDLEEVHGMVGDEE